MTDRFADRYRVEHELGRGAFGVVHLAQDTRLHDRPVALKVLHSQLMVDAATLRLFEQDAGLHPTSDSTADDDRNSWL